MNTFNLTKEENKTKKVVLLGSTFVVLIVSFIVTYVLISTEIKEFKQHLISFEETLIVREKSAIKAVVNNLISDIKYEENLKLKEIQKRVKNQTDVAYKLIELLLSKNKNLSKDEALKIVKNAIRKISDKEKIEFFIFDDSGVLVMNNKNRLLPGTNIIDLKDIDGKMFVKEIVNNGGFVNYLSFVPHNNKISKKISYSIKIKELGITIGSSEFLSTKHSLNIEIINKINKEKFGKNDFIFIYKIMSLSSSKNYSELILEKNIITDEQELQAVEDILEKSEYKGNIFYKYNDKLTYSAFLDDKRTFISAGVDLNAIKKILKKEEEISQKNLTNKINSLVINISIIALLLFILSYILAKRIEKLFVDYRFKIENSQQLLIQKSKMESMGEMIGNIAHQWRQPLTQISGIFLDVESAYNYKELDKKYLNKRIEQANDLLEYMSKTIDDFKEFYNPNAKIKKFNIHKSVQSAVNIIGSSLDFYHIKLEIDIDKSLHVKGFCNEFSQVILNLLSNSRDIAIQRDRTEVRIRIYAQLKDKTMVLHVIDNCGGIENKNIDKIFEPYFTTSNTYGTGIGLYMSKVIIENKMNGKISAKNVSNKGVDFSIVLNNCYLT